MVACVAVVIVFVLPVGVAGVAVFFCVVAFDRGLERNDASLSTATLPDVTVEVEIAVLPLMTVCLPLPSAL